MEVNPNFEQYSFDCYTDSELSKGILRDIRKTWSARAREDIQSITKASEFEGKVIKINFKSGKEPPTIGSFVYGLFQYGWSVFYVDEESLYYSRINKSGDGCSVEGRSEATLETPEIRRVPELDINLDLPFDRTGSLRDERRLESLKQDLLEVWPTTTLEKISELKCATQSSDYIIKTQPKTEFKPYREGTESLTSDKSHVPLGSHVDPLLNRGWVIISIKNNRLFISRIDELDGNDGETLMYGPKACEICEEHEYYGYLVTDTEESRFSEGVLPVRTRACINCINESENPTIEEFNEDWVNTE